jgi:hypothetical protein
MVTRCSPDWPTDFQSVTTKRRCEQDLSKQEVAPTDRDQLQRISPVSTQKVTYKNVFCARCNGVPLNATIYDWTPIIACSKNVSGNPTMKHCITEMAHCSDIDDCIAEVHLLVIH